MPNGLIEAPGSTFHQNGDELDPRTLIDAVALVQRLQAYALGTPGITMFDGQLAAARLLLERRLPAQQQVKVEGVVHQVNWNLRLEEMGDKLVKLLQSKRDATQR